MGFAAGDSNLNRYVENNSTNLTDPSGLVPIETWDGWGHRPKPLRPPLTPDQEKALALCGGNPDSEKALRELFDVLKECPTLPWRIWPLAGPNRCVRWADDCRTKIEYAKGTGGMRPPKCEGLGLDPWTPKYRGWIPTFVDHGVIIITLPNGKVIYLDNALFGGSDDHIFFEIPWELVDPNSPEWQEHCDRQINSPAPMP